MKNSVCFIVLLCASVALFQACTTKPDLTGVPEVSYQKNVQSILTANCSFSGCHESGVSNYEEVMSFGNVKAGNAHGSKLYRVMTGRSFSLMPPAGYTPVSAQNLKTIYLWIEQGAKNN